MRYLLLLLLLGVLTGCVGFDEPMCQGVYAPCGGMSFRSAEPPPLMTTVSGTAEPPLVVPAGGTAAVQTREPPR
jgi:hypothetical protein